MGNKMAIGSFEKPRHISGELSDHVHVQGCVHAQERPKKGESPLLTSGFEELCKQKIKAKADL